MAYTKGSETFGAENIFSFLTLGTGWGLVFGIGAKALFLAFLAKGF
jgi:hypothetical protein